MHHKRVRIKQSSGFERRKIEELHSESSGSSQKPPAAIIESTTQISVGTTQVLETTAPMVETLATEEISTAAAEPVEP